MTNNEFLFRVMILLLAGPLFVFFCVKFGTMAFLLGRHRFKQYMEKSKDANQT